jgi:hypothetical protein
MVHKRKRMMEERILQNASREKTFSPSLQKLARTIHRRIRDTLLGSDM